MTRTAKAIQICGTGSGVGKSLITAGLCRIFLQDGFKVAPFKAQNMSLNSFVTCESREIGRAQAMQAAACGIEPSADMNPVLLKPTSDKGSQVIVRGRPVGNMTAVEYAGYKKMARKEVLRSFNRLKKGFEVIVIEGAGSPAEVNLKSHDIVNMKMAEAAGAPVILVGDIDKGGVFAWLVGTLELLSADERRRIKGIVINKFRGDKRLLKPGIGFLEKKTGIKVLGVIPYFCPKDISIPEEDSACLEPKKRLWRDKARVKNLLDIAVIQLPRISNFTDFGSLAAEPDVRLRYVAAPLDLGSADVIIIPGTKNTVSDLAWLKQSGLAQRITSSINSGNGAMLVGICGGYQMMGEAIYDTNGIESVKARASGLGVLPIATYFGREKILDLVKAKELNSGLEVRGYEIHHGRTRALGPVSHVFKVFRRQGKKAADFDGTIGRDGRVWGTYIHGIFDADAFRRGFLNRLRLKKGLSALPQRVIFDQDKEFDKLAGLLRKNMNIELVYKILNHGA